MSLQCSSYVLWEIEEYVTYGIMVFLRNQTFLGKIPKVTISYK